MSKYIPTRKRQHMLGNSQIPNQLSVYYHRRNILDIKNALGEKCTMLSHIEYPKYKFVEVKTHENSKPMLKRVKDTSQYGIIAKFGNKKPIRALLNGTPNDIKAEYYAQLKNDLTDAAKQRGFL